MIQRKDGFSGERAIVLPVSIVKNMEAHPLSNALHITDIGYYPHAKHHFRSRPVPIEQFVFIYCVEGKGWFEVGETRQTIGENQCFVLPAGVPHSYGADKEMPWTIYWIHFRGMLASSYAARLLHPIDVKPSLYSRINGRLNLFEEMYHILELGYSMENLLYVCSVFHHFLGSLCYLQEYRQALPGKPSTDVVDAAIHYMKENIGQKLTIQQIASYTGYSASHFSNLFTDRTGHSPISYFNQLKIQYACYLLDCTDIKINQVCHKIGIEDCYYFSRLFTKLMGVSPSQYRLQKKG